MTEGDLTGYKVCTKSFRPQKEQSLPQGTIELSCKSGGQTESTVLTKSDDEGLPRNTCDVQPIEDTSVTNGGKEYLSNGSVRFVYGRNR